MIWTLKKKKSLTLIDSAFSFFYILFLTEEREACVDPKANYQFKISDWHMQTRADDDHW